jgi:predicted transcriptional regulator
MAPRPTLVATPSLRYWRTQLALPQSELATIARVGIATVQRLEAGGAARLSTVRRLADALEVKPADLMAQAPPV